MKRTIAARVLTMCALLMVGGSTALAERRKLVFPIGTTAVSAAPERLGFAYGGQVGFATASIRKEAEQYGLLYSFSVPDARIVSEFDLRPDFGLGKPSKLPTMRVHSETGLVLLYGLDSNGIPKLLALSADQNGFLSKLWVVSFPAGFLSASGLALNADGSRIYFIHRLATLPSAPPGTENAQSLDVALTAEVNPGVSTELEKDSSPPHRSLTAQARAGSPTLHVVLLRAEDGVELATVELPDAGITRKKSFSGWVFFDNERNRAIAMAGRLTHIFAAGSESLAIEASIDAKKLHVSDLIGKAMS